MSTDSHLLLTAPTTDMPTTSRAGSVTNSDPMPEKIGDGSVGTAPPMELDVATAPSMEVDVEETISVDKTNDPSLLKSSTAYSFVGSALGDNSTAVVNSNVLKNDTKKAVDDNISCSSSISGTGSSTSISSSSNSSNSSSSSSNINNNNNTNNSSNNSSGDAKSNMNNDNDNENDSLYECNICLDTAKDAVVSMCGHLFCWPCLHQWLETRPNRKLCPVCKAAIGKDKVIPLYGRNSTKQEDPRNKVPPRPAGQRTEPEPQHGFQGFNFGDGFHMSFGIGAFPFGYFASSFNFGDQRPIVVNRGSAQYEDEQQLSKLFLYLAFICMVWLLFA